MGYQNIAQPALHTRYTHSFPVKERLVYLNHAAVAPLCRPAAEAMKNLVDDACLNGSLHYGDWLAAYTGFRTAVAKLINASPDEIAIVKNTSEGVAMIAGGLRWKPGDRIIAFLEEFPANYYPWLRLESRGVEITWLSIYAPIEEFARVLPGAKLLAVSYVNYLSGYRVDLEEIGRLCRQHDCFYFVDAIQGMGALPIDVEASCIDALAADGHKWMLGPEGHGILYVRRDRLDQVEPVEFGWTNTASFADYSSRDMTLRPDAGRYECGTLNTVGCFGHKAAMEFLLEVGIENIAPAVMDLADQIDRGVREKGYEVMVERTQETGSGIVTFRHPDIDARQIVADLRQHGIMAAPRQGWIRTSPHFYIGPEEIDSMLGFLPPIKKR
jgi:selenocysteine lyase/cysteine desulfurase